ncbi:MAG: peptide chain release factor N(5)-glutamine methyltransferase [Pseudomonadota bacterium]
MTGHTVQEQLKVASELLRQKGIKDARLDARLLLQHAMACSHSDLISRNSDLLPIDQEEAHQALVRRRANGEPVYRIIGRREFRGNLFEVTPEVLDPRAETELLIDEVVADFDSETGLRFLDVGTGTGVIGITLLKLFPLSSCLAVDVSNAALRVADRNAACNDVSPRFRTVQSDYFSEINEQFDIIIANPPYVRSSEIAALDIEVKRHDPQIALDGGTDGLDAYRAIFSQAKSHLRADGKIYVEIGFDQLECCKRLALDLGWTVLRSKNDFAGLPRILVLEKAENKVRQGDIHSVRRKSLESGVETDSFDNVLGRRL